MPSALTPTWIELWLPVTAYMAMLFGFSSSSTIPEAPGALSYYHVHVAVYAGLGALTARATGRGVRNVSWRAVVMAILISSFYGVTDEYHQLFTPGRSFDVLDMAADAIGSIAGASAIGAWGRIRAFVNW